MTTRRRRWLLLACAPLSGLLVACSSSSSAGSGDAGAAPPVQGSYTIEFPSLSVAVDSDSVLVYVFPAGDATTQCLDLIITQKGGGTLPTPLFPVQPVPICSLDSADGGADGLSLGFGSYAVLVVAQKGGADVAIGCAQQTITAASPNITVSVDNDIPNVVVPPTSCTSLSAFCGGSCGG